MSGFGTNPSLVYAADHLSRTSNKCSSEFDACDITKTETTVTMEQTSSSTPDALNDTYVSRDTSEVRKNERIDVVEDITMDDAAAELERSSVTVIEPDHQTQDADELTITSSVSKVTPLSQLDGVMVPSTEKQCRSDVVTFSLPLEVIGACWFMKRDTETCLPATTSNDGLIFSCYLVIL